MALRQGYIVCAFGHPNFKRISTQIRKDTRI